MTCSSFVMDSPFHCPKKKCAERSANTWLSCVRSEHISPRTDDTFSATEDRVSGSGSLVVLSIHDDPASSFPFSHMPCNELPLPSNLSSPLVQKMFSAAFFFWDRGASGGWHVKLHGWTSMPGGAETLDVPSRLTSWGQYPGWGSDWEATIS